MRPVFSSSGSRVFRLGGLFLALLPGLFVSLHGGVSDGLLSRPAANPPPPPQLPPPAPPAPPPGPPPTQVVPPGARPLVGPPIVMQDEQFEVDGPDNVSTRLVLNMAQRQRTIVKKYLPWPIKPPGLVQIQLVPAAQANFTAPFTIVVDRDGHRTALVRWDADTQFSDVCLALGRVSLESIVAWRDGSVAAEHAPDWLKIAFGKMLEASFKPAIMDAFSTQARQQPTLSLRQIMTAQGPYGDELPVLAINAYWLARFLDDECRNPADSAALFSALAYGGDPAKTLTDAFPTQFEDARDLELWWEVGYRDMTGQRLSPVMTMAQSRALLDRLQMVDLPAPERTTQRARLDDAWAGRTDKSVHAALAAAILSSRTLPLQVNPVYKNALLSLLRAIVQMSGDDEKNFRNEWTQYLADRADAEIIQAGVEAAFQEQVGNQERGRNQ